MLRSTVSLRPRTIGRIAVVGLAVVAVAGCSSDAKKSDASNAKKLKPAASVTKKQAVTSSTTAAPSSTTTPSGPACTVDAATAALGTSGTAFNITCLSGYAAGDASNSHYDFAYLLVDTNGTWVQASTAIQEQVCTSNPQGLPASFVALACND